MWNFAAIDPLIWLVGGLAVLLFGISKGGFGAGAGAVCAPLFATVLEPTQVVAILLPCLLLMDIIGLKAYWREILQQKTLWPMFWQLILWGIAGSGLGWLIMGFVDAQMLRLGIGVLSLLFFVYFVFKKQLRWLGAMAAQSWFWAGLAGVTSFLIHAGGPPISVYLLRGVLNKTQFQIATVVFFAAMNPLKIPTYWGLGLFTVETLTIASVLLLVAPLGMLMGIWAHHRVPEKAFFAVVYALLLFAAVKLLGSGLGLWA